MLQKNRRSKKTIKVWCFVNKKTNELEPLEWGIWHHGYGIFGTRKELLNNVFDHIPDGYEAVRKEIKFIKTGKMIKPLKRI